ncbi:HAMP domain-containing sensor histidine kinase [Nakamurella panacisegetis]|uniref:HAMP domain-containing sensor histidine kinase n=1 Tax=Nakamurella panacisegetis TaxID=1090615 RepID=UPI001E2E1154|nr:HAMP domain-containing sensor histidine kinase [Nakamurella panacisegetis]
MADVPAAGSAMMPGGARVAGSNGRTDAFPPPRRTSLAFRTTALVVSVAVAVAIIAGVVGAAMIRNTAVDVTRTYLVNQAEVIAQQLAGESPGYRIGLAKLAQVFAQQGISLVTENRGGRLEGTDQQAVRQATVAGALALADGASMSKTLSVAGKTELLEARAVNGRSFALVASADIGAGTQRSLQRRVLLALAIGLAAAVIGGLVVARLVTRPLRRTAETARAMRAGSRQTRAPVAGPSEVADVAEAVNELADALQHSESRQRDFLTSVSHELRTPLAAIGGQADALSDGIVAADEVPQVGRTIRAESARLERLVSDLLDLARLGADSFRLDPAPCDLVALVREMTGVWQVRCEQRGVPLVVSVPPAPVVVVTDARRLRQVLDGLAENALRLLSPGQPLVFSLAVSDAVVLQIRDGGPGLDAGDYAVAFEQGVLHERYRGRRPGGAGLGLALAHSLVTRLGGSISAGPAPEGGACFSVVLPFSGQWTGK